MINKYYFKLFLIKIVLFINQKIKTLKLTFIVSIKGLITLFNLAGSFHKVDKLCAVSNLHRNLLLSTNTWAAQLLARLSTQAKLLLTFWADVNKKSHCSISSEKLYKILSKSLFRTVCIKKLISKIDIQNLYGQWMDLNKVKGIEGVNELFLFLILFNYVLTKLQYAFHRFLKFKKIFEI